MDRRHIARQSTCAAGWDRKSALENIVSFRRLDEERPKDVMPSPIGGRRVVFYGKLRFMGWASLGVIGRLSQ
jgi:hypothetical protein